MQEEQSQNKSKPGRRIFPFAILAVVLAAVSLLWFRWGSMQQETAEQIIPPVITGQAKLDTLSRRLRLTGSIESDNQVTVVPKISGIVETLQVDIGDAVESGQLLADIESDSYELQLSQIASSFRAAQSTYERISRLYEAQAASQEQYTNARAQYESLQSQYELAQLQLEYSHISSPVSGTVLDRMINEGAMVGPQVPLFIIGSLDDLVIELEVPEQYYSYFEDPDHFPKVEISRPDYRQTQSGAAAAEAEITAAAPYIKAQTRSFQASIEISSGSALRPGMLCYVDILLDSRDSVWTLPIEAIGNSTRLWYVDDEDRARFIELDEVFKNDAAFQVPEEYKDLSFILEGQHFLSEGQLVRISGSR